MATELEQLLVRIDATTEGLRREMGVANRSVDGFQRKTQQSLTGLERSFQNFGRGVHGQLVAAFSVGAITAFTAKALKAADAIGDLSVKTGLGVELLQRMKVVAQQGGTSIDAVANAYNKFGVNLVKASQQGGEAAKKFENLGLNVQHLLSLNPEQRFLALADAVGSIKDPAEAAKARLDLMGKSGDNLAASFHGGSEALQELFEIQGRVLSEEEIAKISKLNDQWDVMTFRVEALAQRGFIGLYEATQKAMIGIGQTSAQLQNALWIIDDATFANVVAEAQARIDAIDGVKGSLENLGQTSVETATFLNDMSKEGIKAQIAFLEQFKKNPETAAAATKEIEKLTKALGGGGGGKSGGGLKGGLSDAEKAAKSLQEKLDDMSRKASFEALTLGMDETDTALADLDQTMQDAVRTYGDLDEAQMQQYLSLRKTTEETLKAKAAYDKAEKARQDALKKQEQDAADIKRIMEEPYLEAMRNIQNVITDTFEGVFTGSIDSAADAADAIKGIFIRMAAEIATLQLLGPQGLNISGMVAGGASGGAGGLLSNASGLIGQTSIGSAINGFGAAALPSVFGTGAPVGAMVGPQLPGMLGGMGIGLSAVALPIAALALTSLLGKKKPSSKEQLAAADFNTGRIVDTGGLTGKKFSQENMDAAVALAQTMATFAGLAGKFDEAGQYGASAVVRRGGIGFEYGQGNEGRQLFQPGQEPQLIKAFLEDLLKRFPEQFSEGFAETLAKVDFTSLDTALADLNFVQGFDEMMNPLSALDAALKALTEQFKPLREQAQRLGLPLEKINKLYEEQREKILAAEAEQKAADISGILNDIMQTLTDALNEQAKAASDFAQKFGRIRDSFKAFIQEMTVGQFSPLHPVARLAAMRSQVESLGAQAQLGNADAAEELRDLLPAFLELSGEVNGFNQDYAQDRDRAEALSRATLSVFTRQASIQEQIATSAQNQIAVLQDGFNRMIEALKAGKDIFTGGSNNAAGTSLSQVTSSGLTVAQTEAIARSITGYTGATGAGQLTAALNAQGKNDQFIAAMRAAGAKGFASGGFVGGMSGIDTNPALLTAGEFVVNRAAASRIGADTLHRMNSGGMAANENSGVEARLDGLTRVVEGLVRVTAESGNVNANMLGGVQGQLADIRRNARLEAAR